MSTYPIVPGTSEVWRFWLGGRDPNNRRWIVSETWHSAGHAFEPTAVAFGIVRAGFMQHPFGTSPSAPKYISELKGYSRIYGGPRIYGQTSSWYSVTGPTLSSAAPEAAYRLQRVGSHAGAEKLGRMNYPILDDTYYTDLPHRRHVDVATLTPKLATGANAWVLSGGIGFVLWRACIFHRKTLTYTQVDNYRLLENPTRIWQRWREYPSANHDEASDDQWNPEKAKILGH